MKSLTIKIMEKEINIAAILEGKPCAKLWSPIIGVCSLNHINSSSDINVTIEAGIYYDGRAIYSMTFNSRGKYGGEFKDNTIERECMLFPSKEMRDWEKFAWKKGDVLKNKDGILCMFSNWYDSYEYTTFHARFMERTQSDPYLEKDKVNRTECWDKVTDANVITGYISKIEKTNGGKLNLDTLKIEKPQFKDGDIVFVECVEEREADYIVICKNINNHKISDYCSLNINSSSLDYTGENGLLLEFYKLRLATDSEKEQLFDALAKEGKRWNAKTKTLENLPKKYKFKTMDYFLARYNYSKDALWNLYQYAFTDKDGYIFVVNESCIEADKYTCIPYNDQTAHLLGTSDDWEGGEE